MGKFGLGFDGGMPINTVASLVIISDGIPPPTIFVNPTI